MQSFFTFVVTIIIGWASAEDLRLLDLPPEEAQQYIESKDQSLKYAPKIDSNVPAVRVLGDTPTNVLEDIYLANQYHGQDGLGSYLYGYSVPDIAKTEKKKAHGDLKGAYQYINGGGQEIKVQYWDDGTGFHQIDNLPEVLPKQVEDSPDVQAAKQEFFKRWHEEAERNKHPVTAPGPGGIPGSGQSQYQSGYASGPQSGQPFSGHYQQGQSNSGASSGPGSNQGYNTYQNGYPGQPGVQIGHGSSGYQATQPSQGPGQGSHGVSQVGSQSFAQGGQGGYPTSQINSDTSQSGVSGSQGYTGGQGELQNGYKYGQGGYPVQPVSSGSSKTEYTSGYQTGQQGGFSSNPNAGYNSQGGYLAGQSTGSGKYGQNATPGSQQNQPSLQYGGSQSGYQSQSGQSHNDQGCCGGQSSSNQENYAQSHGGNEWEYKPTEEEKGPPRGFFYNFDYPVGIIVQKQGAGGPHKRESLEHLYGENKANFEHQVKTGASLDGASQSGYQVHA